MPAQSIYPTTSLIKRLVGDNFELKINLDQAIDQELELFSNLNGAKQSYPFDSTDNQHFTLSIPLNKSGFFYWRIRSKKTGTGSNWLTYDNGDQVRGHLQVDPTWLSQAIVYNVFVRFFKGETQKDGVRIMPGQGGTFDDVKEHLDELQRMGIKVLYFNPIHLIGELYRKYNMHDMLPEYLQPGSPYSIKDFKSIDPELTYDKDTKKHLLSDPHQEFRDLIQAAHQRGIFVFMDMVFNHTSHDFVFQRIRPEWYLYKQNITSLEEPYLYPEDMEKGLPWGDPKHTMAPFDHGVWWEDAAQLNWEYMIPEGPNPPPNNTSLKEMWEYFKSIPQYWIKHFGVDGFRCDIAYRVPNEFWKACIAEARQAAGEYKNNLSHDVVFIAEAYTNNLRELQEAGFAAVYGDYSHKLARPIDVAGYLDYIYNISGQHFPDGSRWFLFPESHDFGRTPQKVLGDKARKKDFALLANQSRWLITATLPGIPLIFNGFEKIEWQPINLFSYGSVDWERDIDLKEFITQVNRVRSQNPALQKGDYLRLDTNQGMNHATQILAYLRRHHHHTVIVAVNMDVENQAGPTIIYLPPEFSGEYSLVDHLTGEKYQRSGRELMVVLEPGQGHLFSVNFR